jgi:hypothetical protein
VNLTVLRLSSSTSSPRPYDPSLHMGTSHTDSCFYLVHAPPLSDILRSAAGGSVLLSSPLGHPRSLERWACEPMAGPAVLGLVSTDFTWWTVQDVLLTQILNGAIQTLPRGVRLPSAMACIPLQREAGRRHILGKTKRARMTANSCFCSD